MQRLRFTRSKSPTEMGIAAGVFKGYFAPEHNIAAKLAVAIRSAAWKMKFLFALHSMKRMPHFLTCLARGNCRHAPTAATGRLSSQQLPRSRFETWMPKTSGRTAVGQ